MHTTNYFNTFIAVAEDCPAVSAEIPLGKGEQKTVAQIHFEFLIDHPYQFSSDEVIFNTYALKNGLQHQLEAERAVFFSKGQPCMRCSPLGKRYGWGIHSDAQGKIAIFPLESPEYKKMSTDTGLKQLKAMRSKKG
jgi:hypothetical protein